MASVLYNGNSLSRLKTSLFLNNCVCNNFIKEQFTLPFVLFDNHTNLENIVLNKVRELLKSIGCENPIIGDDIYKGVILDDESKPYALVNITGIDIEGLNLWRNSSRHAYLNSHRNSYRNSYTN